jgi:hypothetical protein
MLGQASDFDWIGDLGRGGFATVIKVRHPPDPRRL